MTHKQEAQPARPEYRTGLTPVDSTPTDFDFFGPETQRLLLNTASSTLVDHLTMGGLPVVPKGYGATLQTRMVAQHGPHGAPREVPLMTTIPASEVSILKGRLRGLQRLETLLARTPVPRTVAPGTAGRTDSPQSTEELYRKREHAAKKAERRLTAFLAERTDGAPTHSKVREGSPVQPATPHPESARDSSPKDQHHFARPRVGRVFGWVTVAAGATVGLAACAPGAQVEVAPQILPTPEVVVATVTEVAIISPATEVVSATIAAPTATIPATEVAHTVAISETVASGVVIDPTPSPVPPSDGVLTLEELTTALPLGGEGGDLITPKQILQQMLSVRANLGAFTTNEGLFGVSGLTINDGANVRSGPGTDYVEVDHLPTGERVTIAGQYINDTGEVWVLAQLNNGNLSWIRSDLLETGDANEAIATLAPSLVNTLIGQKVDTAPTQEVGQNQEAFITKVEVSSESGKVEFRFSEESLRDIGIQDIWVHPAKMDEFGDLLRTSMASYAERSIDDPVKLVGRVKEGRAVNHTHLATGYADNIVITAVTADELLRISERYEADGASSTRIYAPPKYEYFQGLVAFTGPDKTTMEVYTTGPNSDRSRLTGLSAAELQGTGVYRVFANTLSTAALVTGASMTAAGVYGSDMDPAQAFEVFDCNEANDFCGTPGASNLNIEITY